MKEDIQLSDEFVDGLSDENLDLIGRLLSLEIQARDVKQLVDFFGNEPTIATMKEIFSRFCEPLVELFQRCDLPFFVASIQTFLKSIIRIAENPAPLSTGNVENPHREIPDATERRIIMQQYSDCYTEFQRDCFTFLHNVVVQDAAGIAKDIIEWLENLLDFMTKNGEKKVYFSDTLSNLVLEPYLSTLNVEQRNEFLSCLMDELNELMDYNSWKAEQMQMKMDIMDRTQTFPPSAFSPPPEAETEAEAEAELETASPLDISATSSASPDTPEQPSSISTDSYSTCNCYECLLKRHLKSPQLKHIPYLLNNFTRVVDKMLLSCYSPQIEKCSEPWNRKVDEGESVSPLE